MVVVRVEQTSCDLHATNLYGTTSHTNSFLITSEPESLILPFPINIEELWREIEVECVAISPYSR